MKKIYFLGFAFALLAILGCSDSCENELPTVRLENNGTGTADIQIKTSGGNTENINGIEVGTITEVKTYEPGEIMYTININGVNDPVEFVKDVGYCTDYTITINSDNTVSAIDNKRL